MPIANKRKHQLASCKLCQHRAIVYKVGTICSLTNKAAAFEKECPSMLIDFDALEDKEVTIHNEILDFIRANYNLYYVKKEHYILPNHNIKTSYHTKENTHNVKFKKHF